MDDYAVARRSPRPPTALSFDAAAITSVDFWSFARAVAAAIAIFGLRIGMLQPSAGSCLARMSLFLAGAL